MSKAIPDVLRVAAFGSITGSYTPFGTPLKFNFRLFDITNNTDGDMFVSVDGTNDNFFIPATSGKVRDLSTNSPPPLVDSGMVWAIGTQFSIRYSSAPSKGAVYLEGIYAGGA